MSGRSALRATALAFAAAFAFTTIAALAGSNGVAQIDIIVRKNPGNAIVARGTTGPDGSVAIGNLLKGEYELTLAFPKGVSAATGWNKIGEVTACGATAPVTASWNFETGRPFDPAASTAKAPLENSLAFAADGRHTIVIVVSAAKPRTSHQASAVNCSRSNIRPDSLR